VHHLFRLAVGIVCLRVVLEKYEGAVFRGSKELSRFGEFSSETEAYTAGMRRAEEAVTAVFKSAFAAAP
jgi:hypothetical protein